MKIMIPCLLGEHSHCLETTHFPFTESMEVMIPTARPEPAAVWSACFRTICASCAAPLAMLAVLKSFASSASLAGWGYTLW